MEDKTEEIPDDVRNTPPGPDGNGFMVMNEFTPTLVANPKNGEKGKTYTRRKGVIQLASEQKDEIV